MASPDDSWRGWNASGGLRLDARLSDRLALHAAGRYTKIDGDLDFQALVGLAADGRTAQRFAYREKSVWHEYQSDSFATLSATTGAGRSQRRGRRRGRAQHRGQPDRGRPRSLPRHLRSRLRPQAARACAHADRQRHAARRHLRPGSARGRRALPVRARAALEPPAPGGPGSRGRAPRRIRTAESRQRGHAVARPRLPASALALALRERLAGLRAADARANTRRMAGRSRRSRAAGWKRE